MTPVAAYPDVSDEEDPMGVDERPEVADPEPPRVWFPDELDEDDLVYEQPSSEAAPEPYSPPPEAIWGAP